MQDTSNMGIYCIENLVNGKKYIGKSKSMKHRLETHRSYLKRQTRPKECNIHLHRAAVKYGFENFKFYVIEYVVDHTILSERELYWIDFFDSHNYEKGYNLLRASSGVFTHSEESRKKMGARGEDHPQYGKRGENGLNYGRKHTEEWKRQASLMRSGANNANYGKRGSECHNFGKPRSEETRLKCSEKLSVYSYNQYTLDGEFVRSFRNSKELEQFGYVAAYVRRVCKGLLSNHKNSLWTKVAIKRDVVV